MLAERYGKVSNQRRRNDILEEYGMIRRNITRYMRVQQLEEPLKERLDEGMLPLVAAVDLPYPSEREQEVVSGLAEKGNVLFSISIGLPSPIISMGGPGVWGRR